MQVPKSWASKEPADLTLVRGLWQVGDQLGGELRPCEISVSVGELHPTPLDPCGTKEGLS